MKTNRWLPVASLIAVLSLAAAGPECSAQDYQLVWSDEFDGTELDLSKWSYMTGDGTEYGIPGWGNNELQYYREENAAVAGGMLTVTARKERVGGKSYTSARIRSKDKGDWTYCRVEFRARMPIGKGLWAAVWMLPTDNAYGGWAASGEIDIMEYLGQEPGKVHGTLHFGGEWPDNQSKGTHYELDSGNFHDAFHDFALEWEYGEIRWYVDGELYQTLDQGDWWTTGRDFPAPFNRRFHLLVNLAVGGNWPGPPDASTEFPQELVLDYIRVYQKFGVGTGPALSVLPNPFREQTSIRFRTGEPARVTLEVYDSLGRRVSTLVSGDLPPGSHAVDFTGASLEPGIYSCRLQAGNRIASRRLLVF